MPRSYRHIKEYEKEILELKKQGLSKYSILTKVGSTNIPNTNTYLPSIT